MQVIERKLVGWLPDRTMSPNIVAKLPAKKSFVDVHRLFVSKATAVAQNGTDYDIPHEPPCFDQEQEGSCVLNGTTGAASILLGVEQQTIVNLSRNFAYWLCRETMGTLDQDSGTYVHLAAALLGTVGAPREATWPYDNNGQSTMYVAPTPDCYTEASDNKISAWFSIPGQDVQGSPSRLDQIEAAIRSNHPVVFGTALDNSIMTYQTGQVLSIPNVNALIGGHCMVVTGVHYISGIRVWRIRNSWSPSYGDNGHLLISDAFMNWSETTDLWVLTRMDPVLF